MGEAIWLWRQAEWAGSQLDFALAGLFSRHRIVLSEFSTRELKSPQPNILRRQPRRV